MNFFLVLLSIVGLTTLLFRCVEKYLGRWDSDFYAQSKIIRLFYVSLAYVFATGLRGFITVWSYYLDISSNAAMYLNATLGALAMGVAGYLTFVKHWHSTDVSSPKIGLSKGEIFAVSIIGMLTLRYIWMSFMPYRDSDEIQVYVYAARLMRNGLTYHDVLQFWRATKQAGPKLVESLDAQTMLMAIGTFLPKVMRLVNLSACAIILYFCARRFSAPRLWSLFAVACFLGTPELARVMGVSLKIDNYLLLFELAALSLTTWGLVTKAWPFVLMGYAAAAFSFGSRMSGAYAMAVIGFVLIFVLVTAKNWRVLGWVVASAAVLTAVAAAGYIANIREYGNPIYPFPAPFPFHGESLVQKSTYVEAFNIILPQGLLQLYLLVHLAIGAEVFTPIGDLLWHAKARGVSMGWLSPCLLVTFVAPFFWSVRRSVFYLTMLFLSVFCIWSLGVHYSRVFFGAATLTVLFSAIIAGIPRHELSAVQKFLQRGVQALMIASALFIAVSYGGKAALNQMGFYASPWDMNVDFLSPFVARNRYESIKKYLLLVYEEPAELPEYDEMMRISNLLKSKPGLPYTPVAGMGNAVSTLLEYGFPVHLRGLAPLDIADGIECVMVDHKIKKLTAADFERFSRTFPVEYLRSRSGDWTFSCRSHIFDDKVAGTTNEP